MKERKPITKGSGNIELDAGLCRQFLESAILALIQLRHSDDKDDTLVKMGVKPRKPFGYFLSGPQIVAAKSWCQELGLERVVRLLEEAEQRRTDDWNANH